MDDFFSLKEECLGYEPNLDLRLKDPRWEVLKHQDKRRNCDRSTLAASGKVVHIGATASSKAIGDKWYVRELCNDKKDGKGDPAFIGDNKVAVRCCTKDGQNIGRSKFIDLCYQAGKCQCGWAKYSEAKAFCKKNGYRLCTRSEVADGKAAGNVGDVIGCSSGPSQKRDCCLSDFWRVWTSTIPTNGTLWKKHRDAKKQGSFGHTSESELGCVTTETDKGRARKRMKLFPVQIPAIDKAFPETVVGDSEYILGRFDLKYSWPRSFNGWSWDLSTSIPNIQCQMSKGMDPKKSCLCKALMIGAAVKTGQCYIPAAENYRCSSGVKVPSEEKGTGSDGKRIMACPIIEVARKVDDLTGKMKGPFTEISDQFDEWRKGLEALAEKFKKALEWVTEATAKVTEAVKKATEAGRKQLESAVNKVKTVLPASLVKSLLKLGDGELGEGISEEDEELKLHKQAADEFVQMVEAVEAHLQDLRDADNAVQDHETTLVDTLGQGETLALTTKRTFLPGDPTSKARRRRHACTEERRGNKHTSRCTSAFCSGGFVWDIAAKKCVEPEALTQDARCID